MFPLSFTVPKTSTTTSISGLILYIVHPPTRSDDVHKTTNLSTTTVMIDREKDNMEFKFVAAKDYDGWLGVGHDKER
ncbi:hypothetical protein MtrunA17_Chr8g0389301 [Medicago truncatula]|uniref:Uncharacterized protein n=1 Tax=Medicago truncatula TaxID=3880 RepID=A0A072TV46_MEDTR|nr:hypothetical protein MTR_8g101740 [Medicago truncatula]RHN43566.1 hypothetical protein MtrunA17_Chr8g0389301 [Medicago truncatula]